MLKIIDIPNAIYGISEYNFNYIDPIHDIIYTELSNIVKLSPKASHKYIGEHTEDYIFTVINNMGVLK